MSKPLRHMTFGERVWWYALRPCDQYGETAPREKREGCTCKPCLCEQLLVARNLHHGVGLRPISSEEDR